MRSTENTADIWDGAMIEIDVRRDLGDAGELAVKLQLEKGSFTALGGPSGSGKTTLLRILAGLDRAKGSLRVGGETWQNAQTFVPPQRREIGFVFQEYALFENMSVEKNLLFVTDDRPLAEELLEMTGLAALRRRMPATLSGGQKQRVALCRALMRRPKLLLLDEPLSALDPSMRRQLQEDILRLHRAFGTTTLMVSHDPGEIYRMSRRVVMLQNGRVVRDASPQEVFLRTAGSRKFAFSGEIVDIVEADAMYVAVIAIGHQLVEVVLDAFEADALSVGDRVEVGAKAFAPVIG